MPCNARVGLVDKEGVLREVEVIFGSFSVYSVLARVPNARTYASVLAFGIRHRQISALVAGYKLTFFFEIFDQDGSWMERMLPNKVSQFYWELWEKGKCWQWCRPIRQVVRSRSSSMVGEQL